jgi:hypothetical protein
MFTREEYENLINNSPLFEIDKESSPALYKSERYNFLTLLTDYYRFYIYPNKSLETYSMTLMETAMECIKYYDKDKGKFLHLFNSSMKRDLHIAKAKEIVEETRRGLKGSTKDEKITRKILKLANSIVELYEQKYYQEFKVSNPVILQKVAQMMSMDLVEVQRYVGINANAIALESTTQNKKGEEIEIIELQAYREYEKNSSCEHSSMNDLIEKIERVFSTLQTRQKRLISMLLTVEIIKACNEDLDKAKNVLTGKELFNEEVLDYYKKHGELPTAKQIGAICGVSEQSLSRTYKNFKEKLKG